MGQESRISSGAINGSGPSGSSDKAITPVPLAEIEAAVRSIKYGVVQIIVQDGVVVQIDRTEKMRLR